MNATERTPMGHESRVVEVVRVIHLPNCHEEYECGFNWSLYVKWDGVLKYTINGQHEFKTKGGAMKQSRLIAQELGLEIGITQEIER